jgi:DinB superfamily
MAHDDALRKQLIALLRKSEAHAGFDEVVMGIPAGKMGIRPKGLPHSAWELLEHIRLAQRDILEFSESAEYQQRNFPEDYWPSLPAPATGAEWDKSVQAILADRGAFIELLEDPKRDLSEPFPWGEGQTLLREALLIADHNAYHLGEIVLVRTLLEVWP